jgi:hypothetical protein
VTGCIDTNFACSISKIFVALFFYSVRPKYMYLTCTRAPNSIHYVCKYTCATTPVYVCIPTYIVCIHKHLNAHTPGSDETRMHTLRHTHVHAYACVFSIDISCINYPPQAAPGLPPRLLSTVSRLRYFGCFSCFSIFLSGFR